MITLMLTLLSWAGPADEAHARLEALGPHVATYVKESTGEPRLEVHYRGPSEGTFKAFSAEGTALVSVDASHMRVSDDQDACANVEIRSIFEAADAVSMDLDTDPFHSRLIYRSTGAGNLEISTSFEAREGPVLFSWHADLEAEDATLTEDKKYWQAVRNGSTWTISKKTGLLTRLSVGNDALILSRVVRGKKAAPIPAAIVCPETTDLAAERGIREGLRLASIIPPYSTLVTNWANLTPERQQRATAGLEGWWTAYFADELPAAMVHWAEGPGPAGLRSQVIDRGAYDAFRGALSEEQAADSLVAWQQHLFQKNAESLLESQFAQTATAVSEALDSVPEFNDKTLRESLLLDPMIAGLTANAEAVLADQLGPVLEEAGAELKAALGE